MPDKLLGREPGGAFGVRAYSAALGWARGVVVRGESSGIRAHSKRFATYAAPKPMRSLLLEHYAFGDLSWLSFIPSLRRRTDSTRGTNI